MTTWAPVLPPGATVWSPVLGESVAWAPVLPSSVAWAPVIRAPVNVTLPAVTGEPSIGGVLTATPGTWTNAPTAYAYQWLRDGVAIDGETAPTYEATDEDAGAEISVRVIASNSNGASSPATSAAVVIDTIPEGYALFTDLNGAGILDLNNERILVRAA